MRRIAVSCIAAATLLSGCAKHDANSSTPVAAAASSIFTRPHPKPGLWRTAVTTNAGPGFSMTGELCLDASNEEAALSSNGKGIGKDCDPVRFQPASGGFGFSTVCRMGRRTVTTSGVATGDFKSAYSVDLKTKMDPAPPGLPAQMSTTIRASWEGPCPPGRKPGQVSMRLAGIGQG